MYQLPDGTIMRGRRKGQGGQFQQMPTALTDDLPGSNPLPVGFNLSAPNLSGMGDDFSTLFDPSQLDLTLPSLGLDSGTYGNSFWGVPFDQFGAPFGSSPSDWPSTGGGSWWQSLIPLIGQTFSSTYNAVNHPEAPTAYQTPQGAPASDPATGTGLASQTIAGFPAPLAIAGAGLLLLFFVAARKK